MRLTSFIAVALGAALLPVAAAPVLGQTADSAGHADTTGRPAASPTPGPRADTASGPVLSLEEAIALALRNNPDHLITVDARRTASAQRRAAYAGFLPRADLNFQSQYRQSGAAPINGVNFSVGSDVYQSFYSLGLTYTLSANTFLNPRIQSANVRAADADITSSAQLTRMQVTQAYLTTLQDEALAALRDTLVRQNEVQVELAKARLAVGSGTQLDVSQAEVALGQAQVAALQAHNQVEIDKLRLFQLMGVPQPANVHLTTQFAVREPTFSLDSLLALARAQNPALQALRARDRVAALGVRSAKSGYLPTLQIQTGWSGYTYEYANSDYPVRLQEQQILGQRASCFSMDSIRVNAGLPSIAAQCSQFQFTPQDAAAIRAQNNQFPFNFTRQPFSISAMLSLPLFDNLQREQRLEQAEAERNNARFRIRKQELQLTADVTAAYLTVMADAKAVALQEQNAAKATEELQLAQEKYRVGAATYLDLANARATYAQAQTDRITAIYNFHSAFAQLENAVGRPLR